MNKSSSANTSQRAALIGARLRELREAKGLDIAVLSKRLTLSTAQLRQLESGESSLFYSDAIRMAAARKVADFLGEPLPLPLPSLSLSEMDDAPAPIDDRGSDSALPAAADTQAVASASQSKLHGDSPLADAAEPLLGSAQARRTPGLATMGVAFTAWGAAMAGVVLVFALLLGAQQFRSVQRAQALTSAPAPTVPGPAATAATTATANPADVAVPDAAAANVSASGAETAAPTAPAPAAIPLAPAPPAVPALPLASAVSAVSAGASAAAAQAGCGPLKGPLVSFTPPRPRKGAERIFVQGVPGQTVCVQDSQGQVWQHQFANAAGRSFKGVAPWFVESAQLLELQIYFQGMRARAPVAGATRLKLVPADVI